MTLIAAAFAAALWASPQQRVDINSAEPGQLKTLPGISESAIRKIVKARPFADPYELVKRRIVTAAAYRRWKDRVYASATAADATAGKGGKP